MAHWPLVAKRLQLVPIDHCRFSVPASKKKLSSYPDIISPQEINVFVGSQKEHGICSTRYDIKKIKCIIVTNQSLISNGSVASSGQRMGDSCNSELVSNLSLIL